MRYSVPRIKMGTAEQVAVPEKLFNVMKTRITAGVTGEGIEPPSRRQKKKKIFTFLALTV